MEWLKDRQAKRTALAAAFLAGDGIEIGALHDPLPAPPQARVTYVDRMTNDGLRRQYPELGNRNLVDVGIVCDGETLAGIGDASQDFVISSHVIEHMEDPIGSIKAYLRVLRPGGVVFLAAPDRRNSFDAGRPVTPFAHLVSDHDEGPRSSRMAHFVEFAEHANGKNGAAAFDDARANFERGYSIHFHVWEPMDFLEMLNRSKRRYGLRFEIELAAADAVEIVAVLRKS